MTTLRDLLRDLQNSTITIEQDMGQAQVTGQGIQDYKDALEELLDETIDVIKERWVG